MEYDEIAGQYKEAATEERIHRKYVLIPTFIHFLGDVRNKSVLDLACGEGFWTRLIKGNGAATAAGIDSSKKMVGLARDKEEECPLGIEYSVHDVASLPRLGEFDLITAMFLLHYARTRDELSAMCDNIFSNLKAGGRFLSVNISPVHPLQNDKRYEFTREAKGPLKEGDAMTTTIFKEGVELCSFRVYFWKKETYEIALEKAGFRAIRWYHPIISKEGIAQFGLDFWKEYLETPANVVLECGK